MSAGTGARGRRGSAAAWCLGLAGSLACAVTMVLPALGVAGSAAAGTSAGADAGLDPLLLGSIALVTLGLGWRRRLAVLPALAFGALIYAGVYGQPSEVVTYVSLALGYAGWLGTFLWTRARPGRRAPRSTWGSWS